MNRSSMGLPIALGALSLLTAVWVLQPVREGSTPSPSTSAHPSSMASSNASPPTRSYAPAPLGIAPGNAADETPEDPGVEELDVDSDRELESEDAEIRIRSGEERLGTALRGLEESDQSPDERNALRLEAAGALTQLRSELGSTDAGRARWRAYAERLHATASS